MTKKLLTLAFISIFYTPLTFAQDVSNSIRGDIGFLASDEMQGRQTGTIYQDIAAKYIAARFTQIGLEPAINNSFYQKFYYNMPSDPHASRPKGLGEGDSVSIINVAGMINNHADKTIIIGAHYDHLGTGGNGFSLSQEEGVHNGADDNASGVAAIIAVAEKLKTNGSKAYNYLFVSFSGEEFGLWGSNYFSKNLPIAKEKVAAMINLDMVGRLKEDNSIMVGGIGTSPVWKDLLEKTNVSHLRQTYDSSGTGPSDHTSFYFQNIPVLFYFTGQHTDYHKTTDDAEKINYKGVEMIVNNIAALLNGLHDVKEIPFLKTKEEKEQKVELKVTLGIMPDYMYNGEGLKVDGVKEERPGAKAGLKQGDIITKLGNTKIIDIQTYMSALNEHKPGQAVDMEFLRDSKTMKVKVQF